MTYLDYLEKKVLLERLVIGLEEPVLVKGLGELQAKIDSGNGGYNVIHGTDLHQQGNQLTFTTKDKFDHETKMTATVVDDIDVNMGGGNIEKRPVIELDIKFANEDYKKIPFSVSDRSTNTHPILISKGFVENELKALIDVGATNISNDGIDVVYGEGVGGMIKGVANGITKTAGDIKRGMQNFGNAYDNTMKGIGKFGDWLAGDAKMSEWTPTTKGIKDNLKKATMGIYSATGLRSIHKAAARLVNGMSLNTEDPKEILKKLKSNATIKEKFEEAQATENTIFSEEKIKYPQPIPVFNFAFQKGKIGSKNYVKGMEGEAKKFKKAISQAKEGVKSRKRDIDDKNLGEDDTQKEQVNDSFIYNNAILILDKLLD